MVPHPWPPAASKTPPRLQWPFNKSPQGLIWEAGSRRKIPFFQNQKGPQAFFSERKWVPCGVLFCGRCFFLFVNHKLFPKKRRPQNRTPRVVSGPLKHYLRQLLFYSRTVFNGILNVDFRGKPMFSEGLVGTPLRINPDCCGMSFAFRSG